MKKYPREILNLRWRSGVFLPTGEHCDMWLHMLANQYGFDNAYDMIIDNKKTHKWILFDKGHVKYENDTTKEDLSYLI